MVCFVKNGETFRYFHVFRVKINKMNSLDGKLGVLSNYK